MKHLIYFLLFSSVVFSQNYQYSLDEGKTPPPIVLPTGVNNQLEEIEYFKAYLLPLSQKANLQQALNTYGSVRLEYGDYYSTTPITINNNQKLYGHPTLTRVPRIIVAAGSSNVVLENLYPVDESITIGAGAPITNCTFKSIKWATLLGTNVMFENNTIINFEGSISIDCSTSGYFRNNKIIRQQSGGTNALVLKGNNATPSYGNVHLWANYLTPHGNTTDINNLQSGTFVGLDAEGWNLKALGTKPMLSITNSGTIKIADLGGANAYSELKTPAFAIQANDIFMFNREANGGGGETISPNANMIAIGGKYTYSRTAGTVTGFDIKAQVQDAGYNDDIAYNNTLVTTAITNTVNKNAIVSSILGTQYTPWARPTWETLPDPLGVNWRTERVGKPDSRAYIQNLIDTNSLAELAEGVYYIGSTLLLPLKTNDQKTSGIVGKGTGKTVICGLTDDFPLVSLQGGAFSHFILAYLSLQGGNAGIYASQDYGWQYMAYQHMKYVVFREQTYGIHLKQIGGMDNNFFDNVSFVNCTKGFFQDPLSPWAGDINTSSYIDKTVFYKGQYINCGVGASLAASRANNLNAWIDCKFDGGNTALNTTGNNFPLIANCDITNFNGDYVIESGIQSIYNTNFYNNNPAICMIKAGGTYIEGCNFLDSARMFVPIPNNNTNHRIANSTITGDVRVIPTDRANKTPFAVYINSSLLANPTLSKMLVNVNGSITNIVIDSTPKPYPQFLVTQ